VTPKTMAGQIVTIFYCLLGLPLTLMYIAKLGRAFANILKVIYHTFCCGVCCLTCIMQTRHKKRITTANSSQDSPVKTALVERALDSIVIGGKTFKKVTVGQLWWRRVRAKYRHSVSKESTVPTSICIFVMTAYIGGGALLFYLWEDGRWQPHEAAYFCFVTLTTIGFGDYVPGLAVGEDHGNDTTQKLILCAIYVFIGLAFIGMCIDLMQADVVAKIKWLGQKLGMTENRKNRASVERQKERIGIKLSLDDEIVGTIPNTPNGALSPKAQLSANSHTSAPAFKFPNLSKPFDLDVNANALPQSKSCSCLSDHTKHSAPVSPISQSYCEDYKPLPLYAEPEIRISSLI